MTADNDVVIQGRDPVPSSDDASTVVPMGSQTASTPSVRSAVDSPAAEAILRGRRELLRPYVARAVVTDSTALVVAISLAVLVERLALGHQLGGLTSPRSAAPEALFLMWAVSLLALSSYDARIVGAGPEEYKRVARSAFAAVAIFALGSFLLDVEAARLFLVVAAALGLVLTLLGRWITRTWLGRARARGELMARTIVVGEGRFADELEAALTRDPSAGFAVVGRVPPPTGECDVRPWLDDCEHTFAELGADAVAVAHMSGVDGDVLRQLAWRLEGPQMDLLISPSLSDFAGPRLSLRPAVGVPLLHLDEPQIAGPMAVAKRAIDLVVGTLLLVLATPVLLVVGLIVKVTSRGSITYRQTRVGQNGKPFQFWKFRTMVVDAHDQRVEVIGHPDDGILDRYRCDPRVTPVGRVLRRWSIDELPQLVHVVTGRMSLVGPRPLLVDELPLLTDTDHRRHMTKPGLTGLWQVSGRKEIDWDERMRLDLWYVENWSPTLDMVILLRTAKAVCTGHGAY